VVGVFSSLLASRPLQGFSPRSRPPVAQYSSGSTRGLEALNAEQQSAFVAAMGCDDFSMSDLVSADAEAWSRVRDAHPELMSLSDEQLSATLDSYVNTSPRLVEVLTKTPVGPVIGINVLLALTGLSVCDLPFVSSDSTACLQLAARTAASAT